MNVHPGINNLIVISIQSYTVVPIFSIGFWGSRLRLEMVLCSIPPQTLSTEYTVIRYSGSVK
jgi:hypothetical protein